MIPQQHNGHQLSKRHIQMLAEFGRQGGTKAAAKKLGIKLSTFKNEMSIVYAQLGVPGIAAALWTVFIEEHDE
jgi:DNA-binding CsgD family transcriptional regulator